MELSSVRNGMALSSDFGERVNGDLIDRIICSCLDCPPLTKSAEVIQLLQ
jgi:hypothetical protein